MNCRHCRTPLGIPFIDLGSSPPSNAYLGQADLSAPEKWFPLRVLTCGSCWLVQTEDFASADELFDENYAYFSGFSTGWLAHAERYVSAMAGRFGLGPASHVVEIASNDGYLLQYVRQRGIPCTGIEPTASTAAAARDKGITVIQEFFGADLGRRLAEEGKQADLTAANNVLAHVPDINDFVSGFTALLKENGVSTFEFPHLLRLVRESQFDTIYHEHFSYLSLSAIVTVFSANGLSVFDVEEHPTHGGSLRVFAQRADTGGHPRTPAVDAMLAREQAAGLTAPDAYTSFQAKADKVKDDFLAFLIEAKRQGKRVAAYGAAAKGNTLLNYAGVRPDLLAYVADKNPAKQGRFMPGSRIPIVDPSHISGHKPDHLVILPWNLRDEVMEQLSEIREWGGTFVTAVPSLTFVKAP